MIDRILNGLGDSSSSRSGSSSSSRNDTAQTYTVATPNGVASNLTLEQYNKVKQALADYNTAYGIAYSYNVSAPSWSAFNGDNGKELIDAVVIKVINSGNTTKSESWAKEFEKRAAALGIQTQTQAQTQPQVQTQAQTQPQVQTTPQNINIPEPTNVQTLPSNGGDKKGSGLLFPGLILAAGIVGAILLTKKSRR